MRVKQWLPAANHGDAVGDHARRLQRLFRSWGHESDIYALTIDEGLEDDTRRWGDQASRQGDVTIRTSRCRRQ